MAQAIVQTAEGNKSTKQAGRVLAVSATLLVAGSVAALGSQPTDAYAQDTCPAVPAATSFGGVVLSAIILLLGVALIWKNRGRHRAVSSSLMLLTTLAALALSQLAFEQPAGAAGHPPKCFTATLWLESAAVTDDTEAGVDEWTIETTSSLGQKTNTMTRDAGDPAFSFPAPPAANSKLIASQSVVCVDNAKGGYTTMFPHSMSATVEEDDGARPPLNEFGHDAEPPFTLDCPTPAGGVPTSLTVNGSGRDLPVTPTDFIVLLNYRWFIS